MATYEIIREAYDVPACWETTLGGQRWWITRTAERRWKAQWRTW